MSDRTLKRRKFRTRAKRLRQCEAMRAQMWGMLENYVQSCPQECKIDSIYDSIYDSRNGVWSATDQIDCAFHKQPHQMEVQFIRNSRDVDMLVFILDGELQCYTMF